MCLRWGTNCVPGLLLTTCHPLPSACAQAKAALVLFGILDTNGDGVIDKTELISFCAAHGISTSKLSTALGAYEYPACTARCSQNLHLLCECHPPCWQAVPEIAD
jgi:hypothetical protein